MLRAAVPLLLVVNVGLVAGCGPKDKVAEQNGGKATPTTSPSLSADLLPLQRGKDRNFEDRRFLVDKKDKTVSHTTRKGLIRVEVDQGFIIGNKLDQDVHVVKLYTLAQQYKGQPALECSGAFGDDVLPVKGVGDDLNMLVKIYPKPVWTPLLKGGAKAGETWPTVEGNLSVRSECVSAGPAEGDSGVAVEQVVSQDNRPMYKRRWYFGNSGVMRLDLYGSGKGEATKYWVPLRQLICDEWKGDKSPLTLDEIKSR